MQKGRLSSVPSSSATVPRTQRVPCHGTVTGRHPRRVEPKPLRRCPMWLDQFAIQLRQGLDSVRVELETRELEDARQAEPALADLTLTKLIEFGRWTNANAREQDDVWLAVIRCWRQRDARLW